jgi:hypothetical protein
MHKKGMAEMRRIRETPNPKLIRQQTSPASALVCWRPQID